jgi:hypothetical protein
MQLTHYRPGEALWFKKVETAIISRHSAQEIGKVVSPKHQQLFLIAVRS